MGAIAVSESNPDIVWVAGGEADIRGNTAPGDGVWMSKDAGKTWSNVVATTNYSGTRTYGTSVLLPLSGANGYKSRVMILGGGNPATATTEIIDLSAATPKRLRNVEAFVVGKPRNEETAKAAGELAVQGAQTLRHNSYKVPLMRNLVKRAIRGPETAAPRTT